jgi:mannitol-1-/sugar-/sorbitol-6-phosphatase
MRLPVSAVLFDMDGVLVNSKPAIDRVRTKWAEYRGLDVQTVLDLPHGQKTSVAFAHIAPHLDMVEEVAWLDAEEARDLSGITAIPGAAALLGALEPDEWALVTSSGSDLAPRRLAAAGLPAPRTMVSGDKVKRSKPDPEGYLLGAKLLGRSSVECVVFEDAPAGIAAGIAAGIRVIGVATTYGREQLSGLGCAAIVSDLRDVTVERNGAQLTLVLQTQG